MKDAEAVSVLRGNTETRRLSRRYLTMQNLRINDIIRIILVAPISPNVVKTNNEKKAKMYLADIEGAHRKYNVIYENHMRGT